MGVGKMNSDQNYTTRTMADLVDAPTKKPEREWWQTADNVLQLTTISGQFNMSSQDGFMVQLGRAGRSTSPHRDHIEMLLETIRNLSWEYTSKGLEPPATTGDIWQAMKINAARFPHFE